MWNWGMNECRAGYTYNAERNACVGTKKAKRRAARRKARKG
jgi:hypothetical protein